MRSAVQLLFFSFLSFIHMPIVNGYDAESLASIRIAVDEWPPYQSQTYLHYGSAHRIITESFASEGIAVEYGWHPWARSLKYARSGEWDGAALSQKTAEKERYFWFSNPVVQAEKVFFYLKEEELEWNDLKDLKELTIGGTIGYSYGEAFDQADEEGIISIVRTTKNKQGFKMLLNRRTDAFLFEKRAGYFLLSKEFPNQAHLITHHIKPVQVVDYYVIFSKRSVVADHYIVRFNRGLEKLKLQGSIERYLLEGLAGEYDPASQ